MIPTPFHGRLRALYTALPAPLRHAIPHRVEAWIRARAAAARAGPSSPAGLEARLWGGFSKAALGGLTALAEEGDGVQAAESAWILSRWHAAHGDYATALVWIAAARSTHPPAALDRRHFALEALYLCQTGRGGEARALLEGHPADPSLALILASSWRPAAGTPRSPDADTATLARINAVFRRFGVQEVTHRDPKALLSLDNLRGTTPGPNPGARRGSGGRVTVILPAFNAGATLATALRGLTDQTHGDLEILVVDDASTDATPDVAADLAREDSRIRLIRQEKNQGGYAARNRALAEATGAFLTVHDADDWSHPEKIARQLRALQRARAPSTFSAWVRTTPELSFLGPARVYPDLMGLNDSSGLFRRELFDRFGGWDAARITADKELIWRFEHLAGRPREAFRRRMILKDCPLSFGRLVPSSLTRTGATHVLTIYHGLRREYREAAAFWQGGLERRTIRRDGFALKPPFFPAPPVLRPERGQGDPLDTLFIGDFNFLGGTQKSALAMIGAARSAGLRVGLLHYRRYDQDVTSPLSQDVRRIAAEQDVRIVASGETLRAGSVIVTYPPVFAERMDRFPRIGHDVLAVVVNQMAERDTLRLDVAYDPARVRGHLADALGREGAWAPISERVRAAMASDGRYPAPLPETWTPLIDTGLWCASTPRWRGATRRRPAIGRHGRDHPLKWPRDPATLRAAYCAEKPCDMRFLGGAHFARARVGRWPGNWRVLPFNGRDVRLFLADLDIFLHYPDPEYFEEFGRAPMEAMAVGVPVILPPEFEPTFGKAALYALPEEVWPLAESLWRDRGLWEARVEAGRTFVAETCAYRVFPGRLARLGAA
jgi:glycosyltransferase involved in cell wall biosynthesis